MRNGLKKLSKKALLEHVVLARVARKLPSFVRLGNTMRGGMHAYVGGRS